LLRRRNVRRYTADLGRSAVFVAREHSRS
jgi:hypothetical protein